MGKRHNRKRTRSRPRHRDGNSQLKNHTRSTSVDTTSSFATSHYSFPSTYIPSSNVPANHWHHAYATWQDRSRLEKERQEMLELETQRLRYFGGEPGEEVSLLEPMLQVVMDLFDGNTDYDDP
ncbi:hypothetical protein FB567DRAFT_119082 [Paraphoma chrysanthemicola]|uniref:Uncharacterized protein n=1 Tax=Paraphoma chrysanthemicola TaxID=798071 RepID=A0A8K0R0Z2_9PLEO|nr:hypothetical protein FB567DRAFT_119082 [Paraphoma chrysanthemicola]